MCPTRRGAVISRLGGGAASECNGTQLAVMGHGACHNYKIADRNGTGHHDGVMCKQI